MEQLGLSIGAVAGIAMLVKMVFEPAFYVAGTIAFCKFIKALRG